MFSCISMCFGKQQQCQFQAANLRHHVSYWTTIGAPEEVLSWISEGIYIPFHSDPGSFHIPNRNFSIQQSQFIQQEINALLCSGAIKEVAVPRFAFPP